MEPRYSRNIPSLSEEEFLCLRDKRVLVVGCGGLGGHLVELLARIGIGNIRVVDGDVFESSNLNRQLLSLPELLGKSKAMAAADRIHSIAPATSVEAVDAFLTEKNAQRLLSGCHIVLDGLDNVPSRKVLSAACTKAGIPYVYGAVHGWVAQTAISMPGDGLIELLYPDRILVNDKSVLSFTPALCASMQAALCVKLLTGKAVDTGTIYYYDLLNQEFEIIPMV